MNDDLEAIRWVLAADVESFRRLVERVPAAAVLPKRLVECRRHQQHTEVWHNPSQWVKYRHGGSNRARRGGLQDD